MRSHPLWEHGFAILLLGAVVTIVVLGIAGSMVTGSETVSVKSEVFSNLNSEGAIMERETADAPNPMQLMQGRLRAAAVSRCDSRGVENRGRK